MPGESTEQPLPPNQPREFNLGWTRETSALQKGRVTKLSNPKFGDTYLIDVTDREDPTATDSFETNAPGKKISEIFKEDLENPNTDSRYCVNKGVVVVVTDKLDPEARKRVYIGAALTDVNEHPPKEITGEILRSEGFQYAQFYAPFSFNARDPDMVKEHLAKEILDAVKDSGEANPFTELTKSARLLKSAA